VITPAAGIPKGRAFEVAVAYDSHPSPIIDPDKSKDGWIPTDEGAFVVNEPQGSPNWYPVNDTPQDKATFETSGSRCPRVIRRSPTGCSWARPTTATRRPGAGAG
jgi:hypothetical protein